MADDHVRAAHGVQHLRGDGSGVRAFTLPEHVLPAKANLAAAQRPSYLGNQHERRTENNFVPRVVPPQAAAKADTNACACSGVLYIFQLAAISFFLMLQP